MRNYFTGRSALTAIVIGTAVTLGGWFQGYRNTGETNPIEQYKIMGNFEKQIRKADDVEKRILLEDFNAIRYYVQGKECPSLVRCSEVVPIFNFQVLKNQ